MNDLYICPCCKKLREVKDSVTIQHTCTEFNGFTINPHKPRGWEIGKSEMVSTFPLRICRNCNHEFDKKVSRLNRIHRILLVGIFSLVPIGWIVGILTSGEQMILVLVLVLGGFFGVLIVKPIINMMIPYKGFVNYITIEEAAKINAIGEDPYERYYQNY